MTTQRSAATIVVDRDGELARSTARTVSSPDRLVIAGADSAVVDLLATRLPIRSLVTDVEIGGPFSFEALELIGRTRLSLPDSHVVLTGSSIPMHVADEAIRRGANTILPKPLEAISLRSTLGITSADEGPVLCVPTMAEIVASNNLRPSFQAIVEVRDGHAVEYGFESLARFREEGLFFCDPSFLFDYAKRIDHVADLEIACIAKTLAEARNLPRGSRIFINIHPAALKHCGKLRDTLLRAAKMSDISLENVVLEITEQDRVDRSETTAQAIEEIRSLGVKFALDDIGSAYSHLELLDVVRPSYLKIGHEFGSAFETDCTRSKIIRNIIALARDFECDVVVEGVETRSTSDAAADAGARFVQGFYYSHPQPAEMLDQRLDGRLAASC